MSQTFYFVEDDGNIIRVTEETLKEVAFTLGEFSRDNDITIEEAKDAIVRNVLNDPWYDSFCFDYDEARALANVRINNR